MSDKTDPTAEYPKQALYARCGKCGEIWKIATIPMVVSAFVKQCRGHIGCPNCGERKEVFMHEPETIKRSDEKSRSQHND